MNQGCCMECGTDIEYFENDRLPDLCENCASAMIENADGELWDVPTLLRLREIFKESHKRSPENFQKRLSSNEEVRLIKKGEFAEEFDPIPDERLGYRYLQGYYKENDSIVMWNSHSAAESDSPYIVCSKEFALRVILLGHLP